MLSNCGNEIYDKNGDEAWVIINVSDDSFITNFEIKIEEFIGLLLIF